MSDIKSQNLIGVSKENMEETLKNLKIIPKNLARPSRALWDILMKTEQEAKSCQGVC